MELLHEYCQSGQLLKTNILAPNWRRCRWWKTTAATEGRSVPRNGLGRLLYALFQEWEVMLDGVVD